MKWIVVVAFALMALTPGWAAGPISDSEQIEFILWIWGKPVDEFEQRLIKRNSDSPERLAALLLNKARLDFYLLMKDMAQGRKVEPKLTMQKRKVVLLAGWTPNSNWGTVEVGGERAGLPMEEVRTLFPDRDPARIKMDGNYERYRDRYERAN